MRQPEILGANVKFTGSFIQRKKTDLLVLHHAAATTCTVEDVHRWHLSNGWLGIGYHYFVRKDGSIWLGRPEGTVGAHSAGHNDHTIGICAEGDFQKETMPTPQKKAIIALIKDILTRYPGPAIKGHRDLNATLCPGQHYPFDEIVAEALMTRILGQAQATREQAKVWFGARALERINLVDLYYDIATKYGVRADVALAQAAKETGYFRFGGLVKPWQNNFAGIGATGQASEGETPLRGADPDKVRFQEGVHGAIFADEATGAEAHIQHLYAYATKDPLPSGSTLYSPRFTLVRRGSAKYVEHLGAAENPTGVGWAYPGQGYGRSIVQDYLAGLLATQAPVAEDPEVESLQKEIVLLKDQILVLTECTDSLVRVLRQIRDILAEV